MQCPQCGKELEVVEQAFPHADTYSKVAVAKTLCCNRGVLITPLRRYHVEAYTGKRVTDDWGNEFKTGEVGMNTAQELAIRCAYADLVGVYQCSIRDNSGGVNNGHDWRAHLETIHEMEEAFPDIIEPVQNLGE